VEDSAVIVTIGDVALLWGRLTSLRIDIQELKAAGADASALEIEALQVGMELRQAIGGRLQ